MSFSSSEWSEETGQVRPSREDSARLLRPSRAFMHQRVCRESPVKEDKMP